MEEEPIFNFKPLKDFLQRRGYTVGTRRGYEPFVPEEVKPTDVSNGSMSFTSEGIFVKGDDGMERQVFLYKKDYHLARYGKPRFHICRCKTIDEFIQSGGFNDCYVRANSEPVPVRDLDNRRHQEQVVGLQLCKNCMSIIGKYGNIDSSDFVELLKKANGDQEEQDHEGVELDLFGYTRDWDDVSRQYREKHDYTCEHCGLRLDDVYDRQYMHVHHINGDKLNNKESNLKCLCLYCHAHIDDHHFKRLTTGANKYAYYPFVDKYGDDGQWNLSDEELRKIHKEAKKIYGGTSESVINVTVENHFDGEIQNLTING